MTLIVNGSPAFRARALDALGHLCPKSSLSLDSRGEVVVDLQSPCVRYCRSRVGCNLLSFVCESGGEVHLGLSDWNSYIEYNPPRVFWNPTRTKSGENECGYPETRPFLTLAHELIHAFLALKGTMGQNWLQREFAVIRGENQIRREACEPARLKYGSDPVPEAKAGFLKGADERRCGCETLETDHERIAREKLCWAAIALRCEIYRLQEEGKRGLVPIRGREPAALYRQFFEQYRDEANPTIAERVEAASAQLARSSHHALIEESLPSFNESADALLFESAGVDIPYSVLLVIPSDETVRLITNLAFQAGSSFFISGPDALVEYTVEASGQDILSLRQRLGAIQFQPGIGGATDADDGSVEFVTIRSGGSQTGIALYGLLYPAFHGVTDSPPSDRERAEGVLEVLRLGQELMTQDVVSMRVLAPAE